MLPGSDTYTRIEAGRPLGRDHGAGAVAEVDAASKPPADRQGRRAHQQDSALLHDGVQIVEQFGRSFVVAVKQPAARGAGLYDAAGQMIVEPHGSLDLEG